MAHFGTVRIRVAFAIFSTRRLEEITRIQWADLDEGDRESWCGT
jgi:hypothetical protein